MWFSSKFGWWLLAMLGAMFLLEGCIANPHDTELPWATPSEWEGTAPLPGSMRGRYD